MAESSFRAEAALIELGVDSLVAVEIRSWFLKEVIVDMAVLKILGGASTIGLCQYAVEVMSKDLLPALGTVATDVTAKVVMISEPTAREPTPEIKKPSVSIHEIYSNLNRCLSQIHIFSFHLH